MPLALLRPGLHDDLFGVAAEDAPGRVAERLRVSAEISPQACDRRGLSGHDARDLGVALPHADRGQGGDQAIEQHRGLHQRRSVVRVLVAEPHRRQEPSARQPEADESEAKQEDNQDHRQKPQGEEEQEVDDGHRRVGPWRPSMIASGSLAVTSGSFAVGEKIVTARSTARR